MIALAAGALWLCGCACTDHGLRNFGNRYADNHVDDSTDGCHDRFVFSTASRRGIALLCLQHRARKIIDRLVKLRNR